MILDSNDHVVFSFGSVLISAERESVTPMVPGHLLIVQHAILFRLELLASETGVGEVSCWLGFKRQEKSGTNLVGFYVVRVDQNRSMLSWRREWDRR